MQLTERDITEFREAYAETFGTEINEGEAREMAKRLLRLYELLSQPLPATALADNDTPAVGSD